MRLLFVSDTWKGAMGRSFREVLSALPGTEIDEIGLDHYGLKGRSLMIRAANRALTPWRAAEIANEIQRKVHHFRPEVVLVVKGPMIDASTIRHAKQAGALTVNRFPDCSPHAHGERLKRSIGEYDLVLSTKAYHPPNWRSVYGYSNRCVCIPHGYSPQHHLWDAPPREEEQDIDVVMMATWRPQYEQLLLAMAAELNTAGMQVVIAGADWQDHKHRLPSHWRFPGALLGRAYTATLRRAKIVVAPVHTEMAVRGEVQPGDEDTARTYELPAAYCFFLHRRTPMAQTLYSETTEVPMWEDGRELAGLIRRYLPLASERRRMAQAARQRAVPAYSLEARAKKALEVMAEEMERKRRVW